MNDVSPAGNSELLQGKFLVGFRDAEGDNGRISGVNPRTKARILPDYGLGGIEDVNAAAELAADAFPIYRQTDGSTRATFLERIALELETIQNEVIDRVVQETGIAELRVEAEFKRTTKQLRFFAKVVLAGQADNPRLDPSRSDHPSGPRPDLRSRTIPLGPVAVFSSSNFPLAFSVAGGDTASAFAAGCPVIVKGHSGHPGVSELVGRAVRAAVKFCNLPEGTFSMLLGNGSDLGADLVAHQQIKAVGFTGSRSGGLALAKIAAARPHPIPVFAEMSSTNPVFILPYALAQDTARLAESFVHSFTTNSGQMCTCPGLIFAVGSEQFERFLEAAAEKVAKTASTPMISSNIQQGYETAIQSMLGVEGVSLVSRSQDDESIATCGVTQILATDGDTFLREHLLREEAFGAAALVVRVRNIDQMIEIARNLEGQLTASVHAAAEEYGIAGTLLAELELKVGRLIFNGWPTGVEVSHAMVHGGPYPATTAPSTTSVGSLAIHRFLRPISYQNFPASLLVSALADKNPLRISRLVDGEFVFDGV